MTTYRRPSPPPKPLPSQRPGAAPSGVWLVRGGPVGALGVVWLVRPMPDGQWPPRQDEPRDDSYSWWVRSACGHPGGVKQWAFYEKRYADMYEAVFREDPCRWTRCPRCIMIENEKASKG